MNRHTSRRQLFVLCLFGGLSAFVAWSYSDMKAAQAAVAVAEANLTDCEQLAGQIRTARERPVRAALEEHSITELATLVDAAASQGRIAKDSIVRIEPQPSRRLAESDYKEQATYVELRNVTLSELITFLHSILIEQSELDVTTLRLTAPRYESTTPEAGAEKWLAEVTMTYLIFSPKTQTVRRGA